MLFLLPYIISYQGDYFLLYLEFRYNYFYISIKEQVSIINIAGGLLFFIKKQLTIERKSEDNPISFL